VRLEKKTASGPSVWWEEAESQATTPARPAAAEQVKTVGGQVEFSFTDGEAMQTPESAASVVRREVLQASEEAGLDEEAPLLSQILRAESSVEEAEEHSDSEPHGTSTYASKSRFGGMLSMGKYLSASRMLDSNRVPMRRFKLPSRGFVAQLRLWREPDQASGTKYKDLRFPPRVLSSHGPRRADGNLIIS